jgi:hypothetical protein
MDIDNLKLLRRDDIHGTQYIELSAGDTTVGAAPWSQESVYFEDDVFAGLLNPEFEGVNPRFSFFGTARFDPEQLERLVAALERNQQRLTAIRNYEGFVEFLERPGVPYKMEVLLSREFPDLGDKWPKILAGFKNINSGTIEFVNAARGSDKNIFVYGL